MPEASALLITIVKIIILCLCIVKPLHAKLNERLPRINITNNLQELMKPRDIFTESETLPKCVPVQCKFVCASGKSEELANDIKQVNETLDYHCSIIDKLTILNYTFPNNTITYGFLGQYANKIQNLYIASSQVRDIEDGAFRDGIFYRIALENLHLQTLRKNLFEQISLSFQDFSILQTNTPIQSIPANFLVLVKFQLKALTLKVGISSIHNLTNSANMLHYLNYVDLSHNNLTDSFTADSFSKLTVVQHLDLSHGRISYLPDNIFSNLVYLEHLDLSYNALTTLSLKIFGWNEISQKLKIYAQENPFDCSCVLREEMLKMYVYQYGAVATCAASGNWSVFDSRWCYVTPSTANECPSCFPYIPDGTISTTSPIVTSMPSTEVTPEFIPEDTILLRCESPTNTSNSSVLEVKTAAYEFQLVLQPNMSVDILIESDNSNESYGLIWFNKVTSDYHKMEVNYNEYGLGCFVSGADTTTVENLLPDTTYTFCLMQKGERTISPFSCQSIHVGGNVGATSWLTHDQRTKSISLVTMAVVTFSFAGICAVYLILKHKPTLLKGSKRIATTKPNSMDIVVFPKDSSVEDFKLKELTLAKRNSSSVNTSTIRRSSIESVESNQSYINANLYEVIPAYLKLQDSSLHYEKVLEDSLPYINNNYLPPLSENHSSDNLVMYAEVPIRTKRISDDPLPDVPDESSNVTLLLQESLRTEEDTKAEYVFTLDSQV